MLFYDAASATREFYSVDNSGNIHLSEFLQNATYDGLLFYEEGSGYTEFYSTDGHGSISQIDLNLGNQWSLPGQVILAGE